MDGLITAEYDSAALKDPFRSALSDLLSYRGLVRLLVTRDLTVRYKRSLLGVSWTVLNPLLTSLVMWTVFNELFRFHIPGGVPYIVYLISGILVTTYVQQGVTMTGASMTGAATVLTKVYVPPVVFAISTAAAGAVNFLLGLVPLLLIQLILGVGVPWTILLLPIPLVCLMAVVAGAGLLVAALGIEYNDVLDLTNVLLLIVGYLTPTFYPITVIPVSYRRYFLLNPLWSFVDAFRHLEYGGSIPPWTTCLIVILSAAVSLGLGMLVFLRRWPRLVSLL